MSELHKGKSASVVDLSRKHKTNLLAGHFRSKVDDSLDILYGVTVSVAVAESAVNKGCGPGPDKSDETVICIPGIDHRVKCRIRCADLQMIQFCIPVLLQS